MKSKSPKKKEKIDIGEYLEGLKEYLVDHEVHSQNQITPFDSSKGCTIEETQTAFKIVCQIGVQKLKASIEFGHYLNYLFKNIWKDKDENQEEFLKRNHLCKQRQANYYRNLSKLQNFKNLHNLNYSINELSSRTEEIIEYLKYNQKENEFWSK